jgi:tetratricopeptide (TPR) repeat protein
MEVTPRLAALVRRDLVRPDRPLLPQEDAYRFRHLLIRDAAYDALPKATRADLHRRFAEWLEKHGQSLVELDEILGYHLEQAALYLAELGQPDTALAEEASRRLAVAGVRMRWRGDNRAAHSLLGRAVKLVAEPEIHLAVSFALSHQVARQAEPLLEEAAQLADASEDAAGAALARGLAAQMRMFTGEGSATDAERLARHALPLLEANQDHAGLAEIWYALALGVYQHSCRFEQMVQAAEIARKHEMLAGRPHVRSDVMCAVGLLLGPRPVGDALRELAALGGDVDVVLLRSVLLAMNDRIDEARALAGSVEERARELHVWGEGHPEIAEIESLAGDHEAAAERYGSWCDLLAERGLLVWASDYLALRSRELSFAGRHEEAEESAKQALEHMFDAPMTQALWRQAHALVATHRGEYDEAEGLARDAVAYIDESDSPKLQGDAYCDLAEVLEAASRRDEAITAWSEALERYERKGVVPLVRRTRERLAALEPV